MIKIFQWRNKCIGCNACVEENKNRWRMSRKDGKSNLIGATDKNGIYQVEIAEDEYESAARAAEKCPVKIIQIIKSK